MEKFFDAVMRALNRAKEEYGSGAALSEASGVSAVNISRWGSGTRSPKVEEISPIMDIIGARVVLPGDASTEMEETTARRLEELERKIALLTKERDNLKEERDKLTGQVELLKEFVRPSLSPDCKKKLV